MSFFLDGAQLPDGTKVLFSCLSGSHMYGTSTPESDVDVRGVFIPPREYFLGFQTIEQASCKDPDTVYYEIRKFMRLALDCNPNIVEHLFVPENQWRISSAEWNIIFENRELFISKKARWTFSGYATSQLHRIRSHRKWLLDPPTAPPSRVDFGLPEDRSLMSKDKLGAFNALLAHYLTEIHRFHPLKEQIEEIMENKDYMAVVQKLTPVDAGIVKAIMPISDDLLEVYQREQGYARAKKYWDDFLRWQKGRNPARAKLEAAFGYDTKHASHLVRLLREGEELLLKGVLVFPLSYADEILGIRRGAFTYDGLMEHIGDIDSHFDALYKASPLPKGPNRERADEICVDVVSRSLGITAPSDIVKVYKKVKEVLKDQE